MTDVKNVPFIISIPKEFRDLLRRIAAEQNMANPDNVISAAALGRQIIVEHLQAHLEEDQKREK